MCWDPSAAAPTAARTAVHDASPERAEASSAPLPLPSWLIQSIVPSPLPPASLRCVFLLHLVEYRNESTRRLLVAIQLPALVESCTVEDGSKILLERRKDDVWVD